MEIDLPPQILPCPQDPPRGICVKYSLLTKHINAVDGERARVTEILQSWDLNIDDVLGGHFSCTAPRNKKLRNTIFMLIQRMLKNNFNFDFCVIFW